MVLKKAFVVVLLGVIMPAMVWAEEAKSVDCDEQFEACIEKCEESSDENCERNCDIQYEKCLDSSEQ